MHCFMCRGSDGKLHILQDDMEDIFKKIIVVLPDLVIPESQIPVFMCDTCLEQVEYFHTIKTACLQNSSRLKHFNATLKGTNNLKCKEMLVIINSDKIAPQRKQYAEFKVNLSSKCLLYSEQQDETHIKEEGEDYDYHKQHHLQDDVSSCCSNNSTEKDNSYLDKFIEKDSNLTSSNSCYKGQQKTKRGSQKKRFECTDCHKTFKQRIDLERHTRVHTGEKPYKCTTCQKTFSRLGSLNVHKLIHTGEKPYECDVCHKTFSQKNNINRHKISHTGEKPHECDVCRKTFNNKGSLITHKRIHNIVQPFQCAVCSKGFTQFSSLTRHMRTHTGEKPHQCHLCEYKCAQAGYLKTHIQYHTGAKPYSCKHCAKSFTTTSNLKAHKRRHHSNEDSE